MAPGAGLMKEGENGRGLGSRWYPETLRKRILAIHEQRARLQFLREDGLPTIRSLAKSRGVAFFLDPPYTVAGRRLYTYSEMDHPELFKAASTLAGDFLMTYDDTREIRALAERFGFEVCPVPMKSTHHARKMELLIGRNLAWVHASDTAELPFSELAVIAQT